MAASYLPTSNVAVTYFNGSTTRTCFSSMRHALGEIQRNVIIYERVQSNLLYQTRWSFCGQGFQYIHKTHTVFVKCLG